MLTGSTDTMAARLDDLRIRCRQQPIVCGAIGFALLVAGGRLFLAATGERALGFSVLLAIAGAAVGGFGLLLLNEPIGHYVGGPANRTLGRILGIGGVAVGLLIVWLAIWISSPIGAIVGSVVVILGLLAINAGLVITGKSSQTRFVLIGLGLLAVAPILVWIANGVGLWSIVAAVVWAIGLVVFKIGVGPFIDQDRSPSRQRNDVVAASVGAVGVGVLLLLISSGSSRESVLLAGLALTVVGLSAFGIALVRYQPGRIVSAGAVVAGLVAVAVGGLSVNALLGRLEFVLVAILLVATTGAWFVFRGEALVAVLLLGFVLGWVLVDRNADVPLSPTGDGTIVAFGDSYISGEGAPKFFPGTNVVGPAGNQCRRAPTAYPYLVAERLGSELLFLACSGARTTAMDNVNIGADPNQDGGFPDVAGNQDQVARFVALHQPGLNDIRAVLVTIGGNDVGFSTIIQACLLPQSCAAEEGDRTGRWLENVREAGPQLVDTYQILRATIGADVPILVVPYPTIVEPAEGCRLAIDDDEIRFVEQLTDALNAEIVAAAAVAGVNVLDVADVFDGQLLCDEDPASNFLHLSPTDGPIADRVLPANWVHGSMHPRIDGHRRIADRLVVDAGDGTLTGALVELLSSVDAGGQANPTPQPSDSADAGPPVYQELPDEQWIQERLYETVSDLIVPVALLLAGGLLAAFGIVGLQVPILSFLSPETAGEPD